MKRLWIIGLCVSLLWGCSNAPGDETIATLSPTETVAVTLPDMSQMFTDRDHRTEYDSNPVTISLEGDSASGGNGHVKISKNTVTITGEGTYILTGQLNGMVMVDADSSHKLQLVLDNATIHNESSAAIYVKQADKVFITLAEGSANALSVGESFTAIDDNNIDSAIFSKDDLTINGKGSLSVICPGGHGIVSKDDLVLTGGKYTINCAGHGLDANDSLRTTGVSMSITAGKDGIHAENTDDAALGYVYLEKSDFTVSAEGDGISAGSTLQVSGGQFTITSGGGAINAEKPSSDFYGGFGGFGGGRPGKGEKPQPTQQPTTESQSMKGMKAVGDLNIYDGTFQMDCADDGFHSNANVTVHAGTFTIATGDDGFHADENMNILGGKIQVTESYEGVEGLHIAISGGDLKLTCSDDGINAAGGTDESGFGGFGGGRGDQFGGRPGGGFGGHGGGNGSITISGGTIYMNASGDGIDANGTLTVSGGHVTVCGPTRGDTSVLDYDKTATITGGSFIGTGSTMMAQSFSENTQGVLALKTGNCIAGTQITVTDAKGNTILDYAPILDFGLLVLSTPDIVSGETYTVTMDGQSYDFTAN